VGTTFRYVADGALAPCGGEQCHHCERTDAPIYTYSGRIVDPALAKNPNLARQEPDVDELCADCILSGNVRKRGGAMKEIMPTIEAFAADRSRMVEEYHRMPRLPFFQGDTWPMCCGEFTEYIGNQPTAGTAYGDYEQWQPMNDLMATFRLEDFYPLEKLPVMHVMALFQCLQCTRRYWVFQYSGLFWRGPLADQRQT
jgi:uncharacterized protein CbrC (UPF0167 family)